MFFLKKLVSAAIMPLSIVVILLLIGIFLQWRKRGTKISARLMWIGTVSLILFSLQPFGTFLLRPLEQQYAPYTRSDSTVTHIVVLGSGHLSDEELPITSQISESSLRRVVEGIRIQRLHPGSRLVFSGWGGADPVSNAEMNARLASSLGVADSLLIVEPRPRDTAEEASMLAPLLENTSFVLVTSASHLPRAVALFEAQHLHPLPAPTDHLAVAGPDPWFWVPRPGAIWLVERAFHEYVGRLWYWLNGQL